FAAAFAGQPKPAEAKTSTKTAAGVAQSAEPANRKRTKPETTDRAVEAEKKTTPKLNVKDLAILQGVDNVEYKKLVEHIGFHSSRDYKTLAAELAKKLDAQGWKKDGNDLVGVSAILKRKLDGASLTIFVKPAGDGSQV